MKRPQFFIFAFFLISILSISLIARADGVIVPPHPLPEPARLGEFYSVKYHRVSVDIQDQMVTTTVDQAFINETDRLMEVQYLFPLHRHAQVEKFSLIVDGEEIAGRVLPRDEARKIYEEIVRSQRDPALLEYVGQGMFRTNVFPLPPRGERAVKLVYSELLQPDGNRFEYHYPLNTEKFSKKVLEEVRIDVKLNSREPLKTVYSPTHELNLDWKGDLSVKGHWSDENVKPANDFRLFWTLSKNRIGTTLFTYWPDKSEDGYFLFLASPQVRVSTGEIIDKNVALVLDVSGSMNGEKIEQAKNTAMFITRSLSPRDNFNVIFYNSVVDPLWDELRRCDGSARREAMAKIGSAEARGSTDIHGALMTAMKQMPAGNRPNYIIFLTDGLPTSGITEINRIASEIEEANVYNTRLFAFGVGYDVNAVLLDRLGSDNHGVAEYVPPGEDIEAKVSNFYTKIQNPALTDPHLNFEGIRIRDTYPQTLPDLFYGGQLVLVGRYRDAGKSTATLLGKVGDEKPEYTYDLFFAEKTDREELAFVARLWAQKKIGWLIEQIRMHGEQKEYIDEVVALSTRYGIMTPYTSFLAEEDVDVRDLTAVRSRAWNNMEDLSRIQSGAGGVGQSMQTGKLQAQSHVSPDAVYYDATGEQVRVKKVKIIGSKTFYLKKGEWVDAEYRDDMELQQVEQFSEAFFNIAQKAPTQAQYITFAPDQAIIAVIEGIAYKIVPAP